MNRTFALLVLCSAFLMISCGTQESSSSEAKSLRPGSWNPSGMVYFYGGYQSTTFFTLNNRFVSDVMLEAPVRCAPRLVSFQFATYNSPGWTEATFHGQHVFLDALRATYTISPMPIRVRDNRVTFSGFYTGACPIRIYTR
jgi:hypothetical protein